MARLAALLLLVTTLLPMPAIAGFGMSGGMLVICTADGPVQMRADGLDPAGDAGRHSLPPGHQHEHCPACRLAGPAPTLPPPALTLLAPAPIVTTAHFVATDSPSSAHAMPRGSLAARAPPTSI